MSDRERLQEAIALFEAGRKYSKHGTIKINLNEDGYDVVLSALHEKLQRETEPVPLTDEQIDQMVGKPIFVIHKSSLDGRVTRGWYVPRETENGTAYCTDGKVWFNAQNCQIYATEPKGEAT